MPPELDRSGAFDLLRQAPAPSPTPAVASHSNSPQNHAVGTPETHEPVASSKKKKVKFPMVVPASEIHWRVNPILILLFAACRLVGQAIWSRQRVVGLANSMSTKSSAIYIFNPTLSA